LYVEVKSKFLEHKHGFIVKDFNVFIEWCQLLIQILQRLVNESPMSNIRVVMNHNRRLENVKQNKWQFGTLRMKERLVIYEPQIAF
jgi:hypothetical protein